MLRVAAYKNASEWWAYKAIRQLEKEKYIQRLPPGRNLKQELWTLTDHGFEVVLMDRDDIKEYRYRVHAPSHDYLATCLQLGDLWLDRVEKRFFTEQMLSSIAPSNFPIEIRKHGEHIPDGLTLLANGTKKAIIGYEVDLNLKDEERYVKTYDCYGNYGVPANLIVWLVRNRWIADRIIEIFSDQRPYGPKEEYLNRFAFILLDDFNEKVWEATVINGTMQGHTIRKLHANILQSLGKLSSNFGQKSMHGIYFPKHKSPQKLIAYRKITEPKIY